MPSEDGETEYPVFDGEERNDERTVDESVARTDDSDTRARDRPASHGDGDGDDGCPTCGGTETEADEITTSGTGLTKLFDVQNRRFVVVSYANCGYSELSKGRSTGNAIDSFIGWVRCPGGCGLAPPGERPIFVERRTSRDMVSLRSLAALPVVGVVADGRTYRHLLYLLIAVPLWFVYSGFVSFALVFGLLFSVVLVGFGVLIAAVIGSRLVAGFERWLANRLLGTDIVAADDLPAAASEGSAGAVATVRAYLTAPSTWRGLGFLSLKFWVTALAFAPLFVLASALPLVAAPVRYPYAPDVGELNGEPLVWAVETPPEVALATGLGVVGVLVALHLTNLIAGGARLMAVALLGDDAGTVNGGASEGDENGESRAVTVDREPGLDRGTEAAELDVDEPDVQPGADADAENAASDESVPDADGFVFGHGPEDPGDDDEDPEDGVDRTDRD